MKVARVTLSDRAAAGLYRDESGPEIERIVESLWEDKIEWNRVLMPDGREALESELRRLADVERCALILTTGGTGPSARDFTPEATRAVLERELPGFGEIMRAESFRKVPTAILSRATAGIRGESLILNLPGRPTAIEECLPMLAPAIGEALDHVAGFRPVRRDVLQTPS